MAAAFTHVYPQCSLEYQTVTRLPLPTEILLNIWSNFVPLKSKRKLRLGVLTAEEKALFERMMIYGLPADHTLRLMYELYRNGNISAV